MCYANSCSVILFQDQRDESFFITNHDAVKKVTAFGHIPLINCEEIFFSFKLVLLHQQVGNPRGTNYPESQSFQFLADGTALYSNIC